jgi:hypothetical protein
MTQLASPFLSAHGSKGAAFEVSIGSLDDPTKTVCAQYRPKELDVGQTVPWTKHTNKTADSSLQLEFSGADGRDAGLELFFDASEIQGGSVQGVIDTLTELATVRDPTSKKDEMKRPHHCVMVFGNIYKKKTFKCVITSVATKFTMFSPMGDPIRATVNLKLKETHMVDMKKEEAKETAFIGGGQQGMHKDQLQAWIDAATDRPTVAKDKETLQAEERVTAQPTGFRPRGQ